jgi:hypothetical protein
MRYEINDLRKFLNGAIFLPRIGRPELVETEAIFVEEP